MEKRPKRRFFLQLQVRQPDAIEVQGTELEKTKEDMARYLLYCPIIALPSENVETMRAMRAIAGRSDWRTCKPKKDNSGISADDKLKALLAIFSTLQHLGGRDGLHKALKEEGRKWLNMMEDCAFVGRRCVDCQGLTTRGCAKPPTRHLPRPLCAGLIEFLYLLYV